jgi:hypothetical protein
MPRDLHAVEHGRLAAILADAPGTTIRPTAAALREHEAVLEAMVENGAVIPVRFGVVLPDENTVRAEVLASREGQLEGLLGRLEGLVEVRARFLYEQTTVLEDLLRADARLRQLRDRTRRLPEAAGYYERIRLGEAVAAAFEARRRTDAARLAEAMGKVSEAIVSRESADPVVADLSCLVPRDGLDRAAALVERLAAKSDGRIRGRLVGPLPPWSFVSSAPRREEQPVWAS